MKNKCLIIVILSLSMGKSFSQLNESDTATFQLRASLTGNYQQGNVNIFILRTKLDFSIHIDKNLVFKSQNSSLYQTFSKNKTDNDIFSRNYLYYKPQHNVYPFAIAYISANFRRKIDSRYFTGIGVTYQCINTKNSVLKLSVSGVNEVSNFNSIVYNYNKYNGKDKIQLWRGTLYAGGWSYLLDTKIRLYYDAFYQPAFNNSNNYRTQFDIGVDAAIWKGVSFNTLYIFTHENLVPLNIKQDDTILTFGLAYQLKRK